MPGKEITKSFFGSYRIPQEGGYVDGTLTIAVPDNKVIRLNHVFLVRPDKVNKGRLEILTAISSDEIIGCLAELFSRYKVPASEFIKEPPKKKRKVRKLKVRIAKHKPHVPVPELESAPPIKEGEIPTGVTRDPYNVTHGLITSSAQKKRPAGLHIKGD